MFEKILEAITRHDTIIIHRHNNPDGDALGSQVGLLHLIRDNFPGKKVYMVGDNSARYEFIPGRPMDTIDDSEYNGALAIILDTSAQDMVSDDRYTLAQTTARIDHHIFIKQFCDIEVIDHNYESCAGLVTEFAIECNLKVSDEAASALYTGTVTDSGRFRYDATTSDTFRRVSFLMKNNINLNRIYMKLYSNTLESMRLKARFTMKIQLTEHRVGYIYTTRKELEELGLNAFEATRGYVNTMSDMKDVHIWAAFAEGSDGIVCELRSSIHNINPIAVKFGGGGHARASGATVPDKEIAMKVLRDLDRMAASE
ncbi:MAG: bifunctional oligoribonuclease/PAP phosphatase NrnA [Spirochaetales bacterium]|nr:bifunctional oligoribonuclease/PAP phosphatase NrnA [Spirochaetales bacterium]